MESTESIEINGREYVPADSVPQIETSGRAVVVCDRGWIFAGDVEENGDHVFLHRAVMVARWTGGQWFDGVLRDPSKDCEIRRIDQRVDIPIASILFRVPVSGDWGL